MLAFFSLYTNIYSLCLRLDSLLSLTVSALAGSLITCAVGIARRGLLDLGIIQHLLTDLFAFVKAQDFTSFVWQHYINQTRILSVVKYKKGRSLTAGKQQACARAHREILSALYALSEHKAEYTGASTTGTRVSMLGSNHLAHGFGLSGVADNPPETRGQGFHRPVEIFSLQTTKNGSLTAKRP